VIKEQQGNLCRTLPLCPAHHVKYMQGFLSGAELKKVGITQEYYQNYLADRAESPDTGSGLSASEKITQEKEETIKKIQKAKKMKMPQIHSDYQKMI
jgi:2-keto-3-deoxy-6-phosphogluconate aldolase